MTLNNDLFIPDLPRGGFLTLEQAARALGMSPETVNSQMLNSITFYEGSDHVKRFCPISVNQCAERMAAGKRVMDRHAEQERQKIRDGLEKATQRKPRR